MCSPSSSYLASPDFMAVTLHSFSCVELPIIIFGAYCILFRTPAQMSPVKWLMFNLHFWTMLSDFVMSFLGIPYILFPALAGWGLGAVYAPGLLFYVLVTLHAAIAGSVIAIYENRYYCLYGFKTKWKIYRKPTMILLCSFIPFIFLPPYFNVPDQELARQKVLEMLPCLQPYTYDDHPMYVLSLDPIVPFSCICLWSAIFGPLIGLFLLMILRKILTDANNAKSLRTLQLQKKFAIALSLQSLFLFIVIVAPIIIGHFVVLFWYYNQILNNFIFIVMSLHGIVSATSMIFVHKPYRDFTLSLFGVASKESNHLKKLSSVSIVL